MSAKSSDQSTPYLSCYNSDNTKKRKIQDVTFEPVTREQQEGGSRKRYRETIPEKSKFEEEIDILSGEMSSLTILSERTS
jgi:hypothetical protein